MSATILHSNRYGALNPQMLEKFERNFGERLPEDYRAFLLQHNGGTPEPACFRAPDDPREGDASPWSDREVVCFFALHDNPWDDSTPEGSLAFPLQAAWSDLAAEHTDNTLLPIGKDWSGNYICISCASKERGRISFYDHEYEVTTSLAENFEAFLAGLRDCE